jgi:hypothetical protein
MAHCTHRGTVYFFNHINHQLQCFHSDTRSWQAYHLDRPESGNSWEYSTIALEGRGDYIYVLWTEVVYTGAYGTESICFYRFNIKTMQWEDLQDTGPYLDRIDKSIVGGEDNAIYFILKEGNKVVKYDTDSSVWEETDCTIGADPLGIYNNHVYNYLNGREIYRKSLETNVEELVYVIPSTYRIEINVPTLYGSNLYFRSWSVALHLDLSQETKTIYSLGKAPYGYILLLNGNPYIPQFNYFTMYGYLE